MIFYYELYTKQILNLDIKAYSRILFNLVYISKSINQESINRRMAWSLDKVLYYNLLINLLNECV